MTQSLPRISLAVVLISAWWLSVASQPAEVAGLGSTQSQEPAPGAAPAGHGLRGRYYTRSLPGSYALDGF
ncbi:MAG: hypothetical protein ACRD1B_03540, partial [Thermoanaerobaculia bacterium]